MMDPVVDPKIGITMYPVRHAFGAIVCSFSPESQKLWQEFADGQSEKLIAMFQNKGKST